MIRTIKSRSIRQTRHELGIGGQEIACRGLVGKSERKRTLARSSYRWKNNMKIME
jgi:hypothetical protein